MRMDAEAVAARERLKADNVASKRTTHSKRKVYVEPDEVKYALHKYGGHIANASKHLGIGSNTLRSKIEMSEELKAYMMKLRDEFIDQAEYQLMELVKEGNLGAVIFTLKTLGKHRGYVEKSTIEHEVSNPSNAAGMIALMRKELDVPPDIKTIELKPTDVISEEEEAEWVTVSENQ